MAATLPRQPAAAAGSWSRTPCHDRGVRLPRPAVSLVVLAALAAFGLAACGKDATVGSTDDPLVEQAPRDTRPAVPPGGAPGLPGDVPTRAEEGSEAPATDRRVINAWTRALREGDIERAAGYFAEPSIVQNAFPRPARLRTEADRVLFNESFPCGSKAVDYRFADGFVVVELELTERVGGDCMGATGARARVAIKVEERRITEWYRLADDEDAMPEAPPPPPAPLPLDPGSGGTV